MRTLILAAVLVAALARGGSAQMVHGRVVDASTGAPVRAAVWLRELGLPDVGPVRADSAGEFTLRAPRPGVVRLAAGCAGYRETESLAFELEADDSIEVVFRLSPGAVLLDPLEGVEVHHGTTVPVEFSGPGSACAGPAWEAGRAPAASWRAWNQAPHGRTEFPGRAS